MTCFCDLCVCWDLWRISWTRSLQFEVPVEKLAQPCKWCRMNGLNQELLRSVSTGLSNTERRAQWRSAAVQLQAVDLELSLVLNTSIQLPHPQPHPPLFLYFSSFSPATLPDPAASRSYLIFRERSGVPLLLWRCVWGQNVATGRSACSRRDSRINGRRGYEAAAGVTHRVLWWDLLGSQKLTSPPCQLAPQR